MKGGRNRGCGNTGPLRCAVIGLGRIGSLLEDDPRREKPATHAGAISANPDCILVGGCDTNPARRQAFEARWGCPVFADAGDFLDETRPDILHIATHPDSHEAYLRLAARAGIRVVVCEKPLADSVASARRMAAIERRGTRVLTNHERRYSADYRLARAAVAEGRYGRLLSISARLYFGRTTKLGRMLVHDGTHLVDAIRFLTAADLGKPEVGGGPRGTLLVSTRAGVGKAAVVVGIEVGAGRDHLVFELDLSFASGRIRVGNGLYEEYASVESPYYTGYRSLAPDPNRVRPPLTGYFSNMLADAVACARDPDRLPASTARDGLAALDFIRRIGV